MMVFSQEALISVLKEMEADLENGNQTVTKVVNGHKLEAKLKLDEIRQCYYAEWWVDEKKVLQPDVIELVWPIHGPYEDDRPEGQVWPTTRF